MSKLQSFATVLLKPFAGKSQFHSVFFAMFKLGLHGMNFNKGGDVRTSGEGNALKYIKDELGKDNITVFDVGANVGEYTKFIVSELGSVARVLSLEPMPESFGKLKTAVSNFSNVEIFNIGLSHEKTTAPMYSTNGSSALASLHDRQLDHIGVDMLPYGEVNLERLDDFCEERNINQIDFLKLDVEGHEFAALSGASRMLEGKKISFIQFEMGGANVDSRTYFRDFWYLLHENYKIYRVLQNGLYEISRYKEDCEIFNNMNYVAELKRPI